MSKFFLTLLQVFTGVSKYVYFAPMALTNYIFYSLCVLYLIFKFFINNSLLITTLSYNRSKSHMYLYFVTIMFFVVSLCT